MPINRDDFLSETAVQVKTGITTNHGEIFIDPIERTMVLVFDVVRQSVFPDGRRIEEPIGQVRYNLADGTGTVTFETCNRRTAQVVGTRPVDLLSRDLISIFFGAARAAGLVPAQ